MDFLPDISFSLNSWFLCTYQDGHKQSPNSNSHEHLVDARRWHSHPDMIKARWEALGLLFSHLLFSISSPDGVTYSPIFVQVTYLSLCNQRLGRRPWLIEPISILSEQSLPLSLETNKIGSSSVFSQEPFIKDEPWGPIWMELEHLGNVKGHL